MKKITPYSTIAEANKTLDNGGRFFNIFTKAHDGVISEAELCKVAGVFYNKQQAILYLKLALSDLSSTEHNAIIAELDSEMKEAYKHYEPIVLQHPSEFEAKAATGDAIIVTGVPKLVKAVQDFQGYIQTPIMMDDMTTFEMTPIIDLYMVYEIRDEASNASFIIAHNQDVEKLPESKIILGGIVKELRTDIEEDKASDKFLEALYYIDAK